MPQRKTGDDLHPGPPTDADQEQAQQKEQMIVAGEDVFYAQLEKRPEGRVGDGGEHTSVINICPAGIQPALPG
jgi:hypothetical protein